MKSKIKLSENLEYLRVERPSEWMMDEFIHEARKLEEQLAYNTRLSGSHFARVGKFDVKNGTTLNDVVYYFTDLADGSYELFTTLGE